MPTDRKKDFAVGSGGWQDIVEGIVVVFITI
jgi:hypothetical protein